MLAKHPNTRGSRSFWRIHIRANTPYLDILLRKTRPVSNHDELFLNTRAILAPMRLNWPRFPSTIHQRPPGCRNSAAIKSCGVPATLKYACFNPAELLKLLELLESSTRLDARSVDRRCSETLLSKLWTDPQFLLHLQALFGIIEVLQPSFGATRICNR